MTNPTPPAEPALPTWEECHDVITSGRPTSLHMLTWLIYALPMAESGFLLTQLLLALAEQRAQAEAPLRERVAELEAMHEAECLLHVDTKTQLTTARAEIARLTREAEWQDIGTCPSDGSPVWTFGPKFRVQEGTADGDWWRCSLRDGESFAPTHWMPRRPPAPPTATGENGHG